MIKNRWTVRHFNPCFVWFRNGSLSKQIVTTSVFIQCTFKFFVFRSVKIRKRCTVRDTLMEGVWLNQETSFVRHPLVTIPAKDLFLWHWERRLDTYLHLGVSRRQYGNWSLLLSQNWIVYYVEKTTISKFYHKHVILA